ncbi:hypothetical protein CRENBAI_019296 [Crenichthys baileyi]|uniref:Uncharacterized protein n=1 Tax=Crenichthys baileyi TaxID=28760 RepID=A0AAV9QWM1_9TELE
MENICMFTLYPMSKHFVLLPIITFWCSFLLHSSSPFLHISFVSDPPFLSFSFLFLSTCLFSLLSFLPCVPRCFLVSFVSFFLPILSSLLVSFCPVVSFFPSFCHVLPTFCPPSQSVFLAGFLFKVGLDDMMHIDWNLQKQYSLSFTANITGKSEKHEMFEKNPDWLGQENTVLQPLFVIELRRKY